MHNTSLPIRYIDHADYGKQQNKLHICENNWVRRTAGVKRTTEKCRSSGGSWCERGFNEEAGEECTGNVDTMEVDRLMKRA